MKPDLKVMKKTQFIDQFNENDLIECVFRVASISERSKKAGGQYWTLELSDKTGKIDAKLWEKPAVLPEDGSMIKVRGNVSAYQGKIELNIKLIRPLNPAEECVDIEDFLPTGPNGSRHVQLSLLAMNLYDSVTHPALRALCNSVLSDEMTCSKLKDAPAAKSNHHAYVGGLVDHTLSLVKLAMKMREHYGSIIDLDLLATACLFHDLGKIEELDWSGGGFSYTPIGSLVGHVAIGLQILDRFKAAYWTAVEESRIAYDNAKTTFTHLQHIIASHHGKKEWGATQVPLSREAQLFHLMDMVDSRMALYDTFEKEKTDTKGFTSWMKALDGPAWMPE